MQCTRIDNLLIVRRVSFANDHLDRRKIRALHRLLVDAIERCLTQPIVRQHGNVDRAVAGREDEHRDIDCRVALEAKTSRALLVRNAVFLQEHGDAIGAVVVKMQANGGMFVGGAFEHRADESRLEWRCGCLSVARRSDGETVWIDEARCAKHRVSDACSS